MASKDADSDPLPGVPKTNSSSNFTTGQQTTTPASRQNITCLNDALRLRNRFDNSKNGQNRLKRKLQSMDEYNFERLVAELWERNGWNTRVTNSSGDRGIDVIATRTEIITEKQVVQAKRHTEDNTVGSQDVRSYATLHQQEQDVDTVVIVTTSRFTKQATELGKDLNVKLVDGDSLSQHIFQLTS